MLKENVNLLIKPTHECNLNCTYCYDRGEKESVKNKEMSEELISRISRLVFNGYKNVNWTWHGGEPLLIPLETYKKWTDKIKENATYDNGIKFSMQSNGVLLDREKTLNLKDLGVDVSISYDFINQNKNRGLKKDILKIDPYSELGSINVIDYESSFKLIEVYEKLKHSKRTVSFNKIFLNNEVDKNIEQYTENWRKYFLHYLYDVNCVKKDRTFDSYFNSIFAMDKSEVLCSESRCVGNFLSVNPDGDVFICDRFGIKNGSKYQLNNISNYDFSLLEYKESNGYKNLLEDIKESKKKCNNCEILPFCNGGCLADRVDADRKIDVSVIHDELCFFNKEIYFFIFNEIFNIKKENLLDLNPFVYEMIFKNRIAMKFIIEEIESEFYE